MNKALKNTNFTIEIEQEADGRYIADVVELPGVLAYGNTRDQAVSKVKILALRVLADLLDSSEQKSDLASVSFSAV